MTIESSSMKKEIPKTYRIAAGFATLALFLSLSGCDEKVSGQGTQDPSEQKPTTTVSETVDGSKQESTTTENSSVSSSKNSKSQDDKKIYKERDILSNSHVYNVFVVRKNSEDPSKGPVVISNKNGSSYKVCDTSGTLHSGSLTPSSYSLIPQHSEDNSPSCRNGHGTFEISREELNIPKERRGDTLVSTVCVNIPEDGSPIFDEYGDEQRSIEFSINNDEQEDRLLVFLSEETCERKVESSTEVK